jgi:hypothetical protein
MASAGRTPWLRRLRLENPLGYRNFLTGLKSSSECDGGWRTRCGARFSAVCPLAGHMHANSLLWYVSTSVWQGCMYGPNYVKLSRVFAVQLLGVFIVYYLCRATPGPIRPPLAPQPHHHRLHSPRPRPGTAVTATHTTCNCGNTASRAELVIGPPVEQGSGAWAGGIGDADSCGEHRPSGGRAQDAQPPETQRSLSRWLRWTCVQGDRVAII